MSPSIILPPSESTRKKSTGLILIFILLFTSVVILVCDNVSIKSILRQILQNSASTTMTQATSTLRAYSSSINGQIHPYNNSTNLLRNKSTASFWNISIVIQLSGELGNHLSKLAFGYSIQRRLWQEYGIHSHLVLQHQQHHKWIKARRDVQDCFPHLRSYDFTLGNSQEFQQRLDQQQQWLGPFNASQLVLFNMIPTSQVDERLTYLKQLLLSLPPESNSVNLHKSIDPVHMHNDNNNNQDITLPFLYAQSFVSWEFLDTYYHGLKDLFTFDDKACCGELPEPEEHVFHFRNFVTEMPRKGIAKGYQEISPHQSIQLFSIHGLPTTNTNSTATTATTTKKVAMTTRIHNPTAQAYVDYFTTHHGWSTRLVHHANKDTHDFCFLQHAQCHLIGGIRSTFVLWAGLLGNASRVTLYSIHSNETLRALGESQVFFNYSFQNPALQHRIHFVTVTSEGQDA